MDIKQKKKEYILLFLICFTLLLRMSSFDVISGRYLWAEDGKIFASQALSFGIKSLFIPYAGYLHFYPRIISLIAVGCGLHYLPLVMFSGWVISVAFSMFVIFTWLNKQEGVNAFVSMIIVLLILIQPNSGEVFFNITNSQWFLSAALLIIIVNENFVCSWAGCIVVIILGLTGPFSVLFLPILFANILIKKDIKKNYRKYILLVLSSIVQVYFIYKSPRVHGNIDANVMDWLKSVYTFLTFGTHGLIAIMGMFVWSITTLYTVAILYRVIKSKKYDGTQMNGLLVFGSSIIVFFAGLWAAKQSPQVLNPLGAGARYFVLPYTLMFISLPLLFKGNKTTLWIMLSLLLVICFSEFRTIKRVNTEYQSFVWLSKYVKRINIPINPVWPVYPGWCIKVNNPNPQKNINVVNILLEKLKVKNATTKTSNNGIILEPSNKRIFVKFSIPKKCSLSKMIGLVILVNRKKEGWSSISAENRKTSIRVKRFFPTGEIEMKFAFENKNFAQIKFYPTDRNNVIHLYKIKIYCKRSKNQ